MSDKKESQRRRRKSTSSSSSSSEDEESRMREEARRKRREGSCSSEDEGESETRKKAAEKRLAPPADAEAEEEEEDSDDGFVGPSISDAAPEKKRRVLEYEAVFLDNLPMGMNYERSFMHRDMVTHVKVTPTDFVVTASQDGHIKFWKKMEVGVEFVKHFRAHMGVINDVAVNCTGALLATCGADKAVKVFDVINFDMINILKLDFVPSCMTWIHKAGDAIPELAVADAGSSVIHVYDGKGSSDPLRTLKIHSKPVACIGFSPQADIVISADEGGMVEYWTGGSSDYAFPKKVAFESKVETDLYEFCKNKTSVLNMTVNHTGDKVVMTGGDRKIRIFRIVTGKLITVIDESLSHYSELQQVKQVLPAMEFGKKISVEREIGRMGLAKFNNVIWDDSGNFIIYGSLLGIKMVNLTTRKVSRLLGQREHLRCLNVALFQGKVKSLAGTANTTEQEASDNPALIDQGTDPTLVVTAFKKNRFYLFSDRSSKDTSGIDNERDVFNEKPSKEDIIAATEEKGAPRLYCEATIHTTVGDIHLELFPKECPKTVENFCVHARNAYFNGHIFHRVIKQFMIQTGDPLGTGTGGESIWGGEFEDEFSPKLRHDRPYTLSSANAGPNTNGSQFFITLVPTPWLDNKHTVFGRVIRGMEVVNTIGNAKTHPKSDKPYDDISMVSISRWFRHRFLIIATWMEALDLRLFSDVTNLTSPINGIMGPKPKGRLGRPHQQGTAGKRSPKKRAKQRRIEDEEDSDDETLGKGKLPARGQRESRNKYSLGTKVQAIQKMASGKMVSSVSDDMGIPVGMVSQWWLQRDDIRAAYEREVLRESGQDMVEEHIRMSQEQFDRKRMEKFLASNPDRPAMFQPHKRQHPTDPLSDDSVADPDEDFSAEEYMRKRKKATPSPSSEEDVGSWSMSFVGDKSPPLKAKHVAKNKIKDMPAVKDSQQKAVSNLKIKELAPSSSSVKGGKSSKSPKKGGSGSSGRVMNQIKKIKKDQRKMRKDCKEDLSVRTSTYEVKETPSVAAKVSKSADIEVPGWRVVESPPRTVSPFERALSPSPPPEREVESGSSSLILQSPSRSQDPALNNRMPTADPIVSQVDVSNIKGGDSNSKLQQVKVKTEVSTSKSPPLKASADSQPAARNVKSEPVEEYVESREADASSIASEDGNLMDFLEKVKKPENDELVDRYYSPFGLKTGEDRPRQVNLKAEQVSPLKSLTMEQQEYPDDLRQEEDKGAVSPPRTDLLAAYPDIQLAPNNPPASVRNTSPAVNALQRIPGLEVRPPSKERRFSTEQLQFSQNQTRGSPLVRKPSIEEIGEVIAQPQVYPQPSIQRGRGGVRARGRARGATLVRPMSPQVRAPMARGTLPPGVRMRMRGQQQPLRGLGRGEIRPRVPAGQSPILGGRGRIVQRGQLNQTRGGGVLRGQPAARMMPARGRASPRGAVRPHIIRGPGPHGAVQPMIRARHPGPRMMSNNQGPRTAVASPRYQAAQPLAYNRGAAQGPRYAQPATRFASPRGAYSAAPARGIIPQRGGAVRGQPMIRARGGAPPAQQQVQPGQAVHPAQGRPGEAKRKITVELSDRQLAALKSLGIM